MSLPYCDKHKNEMVEKVEDYKIVTYCPQCEIENKIAMLPDEPSLITTIKNKPHYVIWVMFVPLIISTIPVLIFLSLFNLSFSVNKTLYIVSYIIVSLLFMNKNFNDIKGNLPSRMQRIKIIKLSGSKAALQYNAKKVEEFKMEILREKEFSKTIEIENYLDSMTGFEFEEYMAKIFSMLGYKNVEVTKKTGDKGVDLFLENKDGNKIAVQCKRQSVRNKVSNSALQEVHTAKALFKCDEAMVVTTSYFTLPALEMANELGVQIWERDLLIAKIRTALGEVILPDSYYFQDKSL